MNPNDVGPISCAYCGCKSVVIEAYSRELLIHRSKRIAEGLLRSRCKECDSTFETEEQYRHNFAIESRIRDGIALMTPAMIRELRLAYGLTQRDAGDLFGGGPTAFAKYEAGDVTPAVAMMRLLRIAYDDPRIIESLASLVGVALGSPTAGSTTSAEGTAFVQSTVTIRPPLPKNVGMLKVVRDERRSFEHVSSANESFDIARRKAA